METNLIGYQYDRTKIKTGIVHIGVGNFHRAHEQYYTNLILENSDQQQWGICGIALLPSDASLVEKLKKQNGEYTLTICGRDGHDEAYKIGSLTELIWGVENPGAVSDKIADADVKIITLTITEGGYNIDKHSNAFNIENEDIQHDVLNPDTPKTVFGFVAQGLRKRIASGNGGLTILSCDNLQHNGNTAKNAFMSFFEAQNKDLAHWAKTNISFPNSMVDRITPATLPENVEWLNKKNTTTDAVPVYCEDFVQWVIEDNFIAGRPNWERVGVEFTEDVSQYENMKLSLLNASHTLLSYPSFLMGYRKVDDAMHDQLIIRFVQDFMNIDITPYVPAPKGTDLELYKKTLIERFANRSVSDQLSRLCFDGFSKFPVYIMPNLSKMIKDGKDLKRVTFLFAAYRHYLKYKTDSENAAYDIAEPWLTPDDSKWIQSNNPTDFLNIAPFKNYSLGSSEQFIEGYIHFTEMIKEKGIKSAIKTIVD
ncbi:mannitol dehydrogenase family protein [Flavobacterium hercynium]|uniref:Mannitol dehydrogenase n=1 Tax=Flavobacterium hercynium TaxID=387094 RepID=A0A226HPA8_9FLAO|nr:mannitol dehydrogenase family protein [Flavobacterium hercynium]OXA96107.1 mannitol dehydrogenase [Flavobacterium hercynium]SMP06249.1 mannitol 2-dehydrogenase [Flavobacterium hercynium]